ncbi:MAG: DUF4386 domain-containing protein [Candidatus Promineifilaceae bacterium]
MIQEAMMGKKRQEMESQVTSRRQGALAAGIALLLMFVPSIFAAFYAMEGMVVAGDAAATAANILANEAQFRLAIASFLLVVILDVIVAWGLYVFFEPVNRQISRLAAWFRLIYTAVFAAAILNASQALRLIQSASLLEGPAAARLQEQALLALTAFDDGWSFALVLFGLHLALLGYLAFQAEGMPWWLGALLLIAGFGYIFDPVVALLFPNSAVAVSQFTFIGEMVLAIWLVVKGASARRWQSLALKAA